jgi:hypothetical protein
MPSSATGTSSKGRLTSRQAVLANVVDATHVTLGILFLLSMIYSEYSGFFPLRISRNHTEREKEAVKRDRDRPEARRDCSQKAKSDREEARGREGRKKYYWN